MRNNNARQLSLEGVEGGADPEKIRRAKISLTLLVSHNRERSKRLDDLTLDTQGARDALARNEQDVLSGADLKQVNAFHALSERVVLAEFQIADKFNGLKTLSPAAAREYLQTHAGVRGLVKELLGAEHGNGVENG